MISPKNLTSPSLTSIERPELRAYCDFNLYKNDKVLATLVSREVNLPAGGPTLPAGGGQPEVGPQMRRIVANWMLEVCEEENCPAQVFCLAINYLDRFLATTNIRRNQLQLLGAVCLLVSLKVRAHKIISAAKIIEFTDFNVTLEDLLEWEFLLLSKLDWDLSAVIAPDYVDHILLRLPVLDTPDIVWSLEGTRRNAETLIYMCYSQPSLALYPPSLIAAASVITTLRPVLDRVPHAHRDTPSPSSCSSPSSESTHSSPTSSTSREARITDPIDQVIDAVERLTLAERSLVMECMEKLEELMRASLPPSPSPSPEGLIEEQYTSGPCSTPPPSPSLSHSPPLTILSTPLTNFTTPTTFLSTPIRKLSKDKLETDSKVENSTKS